MIKNRSLITVTVLTVLSILLVMNNSCAGLTPSPNYNSNIKVSGFSIPSKVEIYNDKLYVLDKTKGLYILDLPSNSQMFTQGTTVSSLSASLIANSAPALWYDSTSDTSLDYTLYPVDFAFTSDNKYIFAITKCTIDPDGSGSSYSSEIRYYINRIEVANPTSFDASTDLLALDAFKDNSTDTDYDMNNKAFFITANNNALYLSDYYKSLRVILINSDSLHKFSSINDVDASGDRVVISKKQTFYPGNIAVKNNTIFLSSLQSNESGIDVYDYLPNSDDHTPDYLGNKFSSLPSYPFDMLIENNYLYCATSSGLYIYDINSPFDYNSMPPNLVNYTKFKSNVSTNSVFLYNNVAYCAYGNGVKIIPSPLTSSDVSDDILIEGWVSDSVVYHSGSSDYLISPSQVVSNDQGALIINKLN